MVAHNPNRPIDNKLKSTPGATTECAIVRLDPSDLNHFEFALKRCGSFSGQSIASTQSWSDSPAAREHRRKFLHAQNLTKFNNLNTISKKNHLTNNNWDCVSQLSSGYDTPTDNCNYSRARCNTHFHSYRFIVTMLGGTSVGLMLLLRFNITIAILQMVNQTHLYLVEHPNATIEDFENEGYSLLETGGQFNWNNEIVAIILAWYMFGYTLPGPLMAKLGSMLGCRLAVPLLLATCACSTLLTPAACHLGWQYVVACRLLNGLGASAVIPQLLSLIEKWVRYDEITAGLSLAYLLNASLAAITPLLCGFLTKIHWSYAFYVPALFTLCFCLLWLVLITDEPHTNWLISERELDYLADCERINNTINSKEEEENCKNNLNKQQQQQVAIEQMKGELCNEPDSWLQIFQVPSFYAYIALWCCYCSTYSGFVFVLPAYMQQFLKIPVSENGFYCFIIQLGCIISVLWPHQMLKLFNKTLGLAMARARIACYALCCSVGAFTWIYVGTTHSSQLPLLFLNRAAHPGNDVLVTSCLMANYAKAGLSGHAFAVVNTIGNFSIVISSTFIGWLLDYTGASATGWCYIFIGLGATQLVMFVIFATCVSAEPIKFRRSKWQGGGSKGGVSNC